MIESKKNIEILSSHIWEKSSKASKYYPIDRSFLEPYVGEIIDTNVAEFIAYNLNSYSELYTSSLFLCLPELWSRLSLKDIESIVSLVEHEVALFSLLKFMYKYVQVDVINFLMQNSQLEVNYKKAILNYLTLQSSNLIFNEEDKDDFNDEYLGIALDEWLYVKQRWLLDPQVQPAIQDITRLNSKVSKLLEKSTE